MLKSGAGILLGLLIALPTIGVGAEGAAGAANAPPTTQQVLEQVRNDLQAVETDAISQAVSLTTDEATKFWPVFKKFQDEQKAIIDGQLAAIKKYSDNYANLTDAQATEFVDSLLDRDQRMHDLRVKYLKEYSKVIPASKAARVIHVSRRLGLVSQMQIAASIPLVR